ncbi:MAG: hypothetical protein AB7Q97_13755 [Gammaproteobacteria bacterium]
MPAQNPPADASQNDFQIDTAELCREDVYTDRKVGTIRQLTPVRVDGSTDPSRPVTFSGQTQLLTPMGSIPLAFEIPAANLAEAIENYPQAMREAVERTVEEVKELRRQAASSIIVPEGGGMGGMGGPGGRPGGGRIQF